jgi:hypothetical protein
MHHTLRIIEINKLRIISPISLFPRPPCRHSEALIIDLLFLDFARDALMQHITVSRFLILTSPHQLTPASIISSYLPSLHDDAETASAVLVT